MTRDGANDVPFTLEVHSSYRSRYSTQSSVCVSVCMDNNFQVKCWLTFVLPRSCFYFLVLLFPTFLVWFRAVDYADLSVLSARKK